MTREDWLNKLKQPHRKRAIGNCDYLDEECFTFDFALSGAFVWEATDEGHAYWQDINNNPEKYFLKKELKHS